MPAQPRKMSEILKEMSEFLRALVPPDLEARQLTAFAQP